MFQGGLGMMPGRRKQEEEIARYNQMMANPATRRFAGGGGMGMGPMSPADQIRAQAFGPAPAGMMQAPGRNNGWLKGALALGAMMAIAKNREGKGGAENGGTVDTAAADAATSKASNGTEALAKLMAPGQGVDPRQVIETDRNNKATIAHAQKLAREAEGKPPAVYPGATVKADDLLQRGSGTASPYTAKMDNGGMDQPGTAINATQGKSAAAAAAGAVPAATSTINPLAGAAMAAGTELLGGLVGGGGDDDAMEMQKDMLHRQNWNDVFNAFQTYTGSLRARNDRFRDAMWRL